LQNLLDGNGSAVGDVGLVVGPGSVVGGSVVGGSAVLAVQFPEFDDTYCSSPMPAIEYGPVPEHVKLPSTTYAEGRILITESPLHIRGLAVIV